MKALIALLALIALPALAQTTGPTAVLTWTAPTSNTDGTSITGPLTYNVYQGTSPTTLTKVASNVTATTNSITTGLSDGVTYYWSVTAVVGGVESAQSLPVSKQFSPGTPSAVINLTVK